MIQGIFNLENGMMNGFSDIGMWHFYTRWELQRGKEIGRV